jgi:hypothetical protein
MRRSRVRRLVLDDGRVVEDEGEILVAVTNFYKELFISHADNNMVALINCVAPKVTAEMTTCNYNILQKRRLSKALIASEI